MCIMTGVKRLARWIVNGATVLLALLCMAAAGMWVRSYRVIDIVQYSSAQRLDACPWNLIFQSQEGRLSLRLFRQYEPAMFVHDREVRRMSIPASAMRDSAPSMGAEFPWLEHHSQLQTRDGDKEAVLKNGTLSSSIYLPAARIEFWRVWYGVAVFVFALLPVVRISRYWIRRGRMKPGCCAVCGYDLRASTARCPECGTERVG